jgi:hypothetical protein
MEEEEKLDQRIRKIRDAGRREERDFFFFFNAYNKACECYSATKCVGLYCSILKEYKNIESLLWVIFL